MSYYDEDNYDDHRRHKGDRDRRQRTEPKYEEEEIIRARSGPKGSSKDLIPSPRQRRRDSSDSSIEEIPRDFPPRGGGYDKRSDYSSRRARSAKDSRRGGRHDDYDDGYYDERPKKRGSKRDRRRDYSSSSSSRSRSRGPDRDRRKSLGEQALGALGIGGAGAAALGALAGQRSKSHDRDDRSSRRDRRSRRYSSSSSRSRGRGSKDMDMNAKMLQAAKAAVTAGGIEAWRMRKEPGGWGGPKGKRVLTAAIGAAGVDGLLGGDKNGGGGGNVIQSTIGGLVGNRLLNGSRKDERSRSRSRGRDDSRDRGSKGIAGLGAGALAAAATKAFENRSKSRGRGKRDYSSSDDDDYGRRRGGGRRSKSVSDYMRQGMAGLGIGSNKDKRDTTDRGTPRDLGNESDSESEDPHSQLRAGPNGAAMGALAHVKHNQDDSSSSDDDISSSEEERERKKLGKKQLITAGLASVATIHAAHNVYQSVHMRKVRAKEVAEGDMSPEQARKKKNNARLHNAASIGIAALGVRGAYSEWKEMQESRHEVREFDEKRERRHERRLERAMRQQDGHTVETASSSMSGHSTPQQYHGPAAASSVSSYNEYMSSHYPVTAPNMRSNDPNRYYSEQQTGPGPHYSDGNPYQAARAQPVPHHHAPVPHMAPPPAYH